MTRMFSVMYLRNILVKATSHLSESTLWQIFSLSLKQLLTRPEHFAFENIQGDLAFKSADSNTLEQFLTLFPDIRFPTTETKCPNNLPGDNYRTVITGQYLTIQNIRAVFREEVLHREETNVPKIQTRTRNIEPQEEKSCSGVFLFTVNNSDKVLGIDSKLGKHGCLEIINLSFDSIGNMLLSTGDFTTETLIELERNEDHGQEDAEIIVS